MLSKISLTDPLVLMPHNIERLISTWKVEIIIVSDLFDFEGSVLCRLLSVPRKGKVMSSLFPFACWFAILNCWINATLWRDSE